jgi:hypothetical protein
MTGGTSDGAVGHWARLPASRLCPGTGTGQRAQGTGPARVKPRSGGPVDLAVDDDPGFLGEYELEVVGIEEFGDVGEHQG